MGKADEAKSEHESKIELHESLVNRFPGVQQYIIERGNSYQAFARFLVQIGKPSESLIWFDRTIEHISSLSENNPKSLQLNSNLAACYDSRAVAHTSLKNHPAANEDWGRAIELAGPVPVLQTAIQASRVEKRFEAGLIDESLSEINELVKNAKLNANTLYNFSCYYSQASKSEVVQKKLFLDRAVALLSKAIDAGYKDLAHIEKDTDLDPIRDRADFKKFLEENRSEGLRR